MTGGFVGSSKDIRLVDGHKLVAKCRNEHGEWKDSELDLNRCIGNLNGYLAWDEPNFQHTAQDISLVEGGAKLDATLRQVGGANNTARQGIRLNDRIENRNGRLYFVPSNELR